MCFIFYYFNQVENILLCLPLFYFYLTQIEKCCFYCQLPCRSKHLLTHIEESDIFRSKGNSIRRLVNISILWIKDFVFASQKSFVWRMYANFHKEIISGESGKSRDIMKRKTHKSEYSRDAKLTHPQRPLFEQKRLAIAHLLRMSCGNVCIIFASAQLFDYIAY